MAFVFTSNILLPTLEDKFGHLIIALRDALVASGLWRVRGSGDGKAAVQLMGQTAGPYDVFTASPAWSQDASVFNTVRNGSITQPRAWLLLEEIPSGRVLLMQRCQNTGSTTDSSALSVGVATGVASSGATAIQPPALTGNSAFLAGNAWPITSPNVTEVTSSNSTEYAIGSTRQCWLQIAVENTARAGNVCPWWFAVWDKSANIPVMGGIWESLTDVDTGVNHPLACAFGSWSRVWGTVGNGNTGPINVSSAWRGGDTLALCTTGYSQNIGIGATPPTYQAPGNNGKVRTERPWLLVPALGSRHIGRFEHGFMNKSAREYPTTYDVAGAQPRITLGHLIMPWTAVSPESSP